LISLAGAFAAALGEYAVAGWWRRGADRARYQARWAHRHAQHIARRLHLKVKLIGRWHATPLIAANHLGYLDIVTLAAVAPVRFVAKAEVRDWPVFGRLAQCAGTIFLARADRRRLVEINAVLRGAVADGGGIVIFPEATSTDGRQVLPFRSSLLAVAAAEPHPVLPVGLRYAVDDGDAAQEVCWWGDMTLVPHLWRLLGLREIRATVCVGRPIWHWDRKELAVQLHQAVTDLARPVAVRKVSASVVAECV
jgi:1-acyl-sn-glycerol-3-phosphate acyltransferase